jgi:hypothetical protein
VTMARISCIAFEICNIENSVQWINENLWGMTNLKRILSSLHSRSEHSRSILH